VSARRKAGNLFIWLRFNVQTVFLPTVCTFAVYGGLKYNKDSRSNPAGHIAAYRIRAGNREVKQ